MPQERGKTTSNLCGHRIKVSRVDNEMTQMELAAAVSVDHKLRFDESSIGAIERGRRFVKDFELVALAKVLRRHPMWLLFGNDIPKDFE